MIDKVSRIRRISTEKYEREQSKNEEEKKQPEQFEDMLEQVVTGLMGKDRDV